MNFDVSPHFEEPDGDPLRFEAGNLPAGLVIDEDSGVISGTIELGAEGFYPVLILVYDPENESTGQTFNWTVDEIDTSIFRSGFE